MAISDTQRALGTATGAVRAGRAAYGLTQGAPVGAGVAGVGALLSALAAATGNSDLADAAQAVSLATTVGGAIGATTSAEAAGALASGAAGAALPLAAVAPVLMGAIQVAQHLGSRKAKQFAQRQAERKSDAGLGQQADEVLRRLSDVNARSHDPALISNAYGRALQIADARNKFGGTRSDLDRHMQELENEAAYGGRTVNRAYLENILQNEAKVANAWSQATDKARKADPNFAALGGRDVLTDMLNQNQTLYALGTDPADMLVHQSALQVNPRLDVLGTKGQRVKERTGFRPLNYSDPAEWSAFKSAYGGKNETYDKYIQSVERGSLTPTIYVPAGGLPLGEGVKAPTPSPTDYGSP